MATNNIISRTDAAALIPEEVSRTMLTNLDAQSAVLSTFRRVPVGRAQVRFPIVTALPAVEWVNGDTGLKPTTEVNWDNKFLNIEELAAVIPIPENVLDDTDMPIWDSVMPLVENEMGRALDAAVFFGTNAPASFPDDIVTDAAAAGNTAVIGTSAANAGGIVTDLGTVLSAVEADGFSPDTAIATKALRGAVRSARNADGDRYQEISINRDGFEIDGVTYTHPMSGLWPTAVSTARAIVYDREQFVVGVRQDISWKLITEGVITDAAGNIVYNLPQQDMVAMRVKFRVGWQVANTINYDQPTEGDRYPAGVLLAASS